MNTRLEIASRLMAAAESRGCSMTDRQALQLADALIAEEARTRPPAKDASADLRAVAEELMAVAVLYRADPKGDCRVWNYGEKLMRCGWDGKQDQWHFRFDYTANAIARARAIGLGAKHEGGGR